MKSAMFAVFALMPGAALSPAADPASAASQVVVGFTGGAVWTTPSTGICIPQPRRARIRHVHLLG